MSTNITITRSEIESMDSAEIRKYIGSARASFKSADKSARNATDRAAYATWMAEFVQGVIGKDNKPGKDDVDPGWMTDERWADGFDKVKSITGAWRTLGRVLVDLNLDRDGDVYMRLRNSNVYQTRDCKDLIGKATPETVEADLVAFMEGKVDEFGKRVPKARAAQPNDGTTDSTPSNVTDAVEAVKGDDTAKALVLVGALATVVGRLDTDAWVEVDAAIEALRKATNDKFAADLSIAG